MESTKIILDENEMPQKWYNILPDLPNPLDPPLNPATNEPIKIEELEPIFAGELIKQELSSDRYISIPEEILDIYRMWRPSPLYRAKNLKTFSKRLQKYIINMKA